MKGFKLEPVAWLTTIAAVLTALTAATAAPPLNHMLPDAVTVWLGVATAVVTAVLGAVARGKVTPLAAPRDNSDRPLVPTSTTRPVA